MRPGPTGIPPHCGLATMRRAAARWAVAAALVATTVGCGIEPAFEALAGGSGLPNLPDPAPSYVRGWVTAAPGATVSLHTPAGPLPGQQVTADAEGAFLLTLPGSSTLPDLRVWARRDAWAATALVPSVTARASVLDPYAVFDLAALPGMEDVGVTSTTLTLGLLAASHGALPSGQARVDAAAAALDRLQSGDPAWKTLYEMVVRLLDAAREAPPDTPAPFDTTWNGQADAPILTGAFLALGVDYTGDGTPDATSDPFDAAVAAAAEALQIEAGCTPEGWVRVVLQVELTSEMLDGNCDSIDPFKWADEAPGKRVFVTGGILAEQGETPLCSAERPTWCLTPEAAAAASLLLGDWIPNKIEMFDDGTHGDALAGDGLWTRAFVLPYIPTDRSPDGRGVRIGYKYTYGQPGQGWTSTEEWPGNRRILQLEDEDGDGIVLRHDLFGDETANKDKANLLTPAHGGCGVNKWPEAATPNCQADTGENWIDTDGDCEPDAPPPHPPVGPVTCEEVEALRAASPDLQPPVTEP